MAPFRMILLLLAMSHLCNAQSCLTGGITFANQEQIDNFSLLHPNCTTIDGDVKIGDFPYPYSSTNIVNLSGLSSIVQINGSLNIFYNTNLEDLSGLSNLTYLANSLTIDNNDELVNLQGLDSLTSIGGFLGILDNKKLFSLDGISNLQSIGSYLTIHDNELLASIQGIENINPASIEAPSSSQNDFELYNNLDLSSCALNNICSVLNTQSSNMMVHNNGIDCESIGDIDLVCNPSCGIVNTVDGSGFGSLTYNLECISSNDTILIDPALAQDTIWLSESTIDFDKSFVLIGPIDRVMIASTLEAPLIDNKNGQQIHLINIDLHKLNPIVDTIIQNQGILILEDCDVYSGLHKGVQTNSGQLIIRGNTSVKD